MTREDEIKRRTREKFALMQKPAATPAPDDTKARIERLEAALTADPDEGEGTDD